MNKDKFEKLKEEAKNANYSEEEINDFINMAAKYSCKPVLHALIDVVKASVDKIKTTDETVDSRQKECERLEKLIIKQLKYDYTGYVSLSFEEIQHQLNVQLTLVDKDYQSSIDIPDVKYAKELFKQYDFLKMLAIAYWRQFTEDHKTLMKRICDFCCDVDLSTLKIDPKSPTTLYWDVNQRKRIGILSYYTLNGKAFYKK